MSQSNRSQNEPFTIKGHWWLPGNTNKVAGDLTYEVENISLALYGGLNDARVDSPFCATPTRSDFPIIYGESLDRVPITILKAFYTKWKPNIRTLAVRSGTCTGLLSSRLSCSEVVEGLHLSLPKDTFIKCRIDMPYFENWLGDSPFKFDMAGSGEHVRIDYNRPKNEEFPIATCKCLVRFIRSMKLSGFPSHTPSIEHLAAVEIVPSQPMTVSLFQTHASEIVDLFSFLYGGNIQSRQLTLFKNNTDDSGATLYYRRHKVKSIEYGAMDCLVRYEHVKKVFAQILKEWLTATENTKRARRMLLASERSPSRFMERQFLRLMAVAEVLTKKSDHSTIVDPVIFNNVREQMLACLPGNFPTELANSIKSSLGYANGHNLNRKLTNMLNELHDETCRLFCADNAKFIQGIVNARNYHTHYSPKKNLLQDEELHWAIKKLSLMLRILLLLKVGVSENDLQQLVHSCHRLSGDRSVWSSITEEGSAFDASNG